jgi:hypothetical protein
MPYVYSFGTPTQVAASTWTDYPGSAYTIPRTGEYTWCLKVAGYGGDATSTVLWGFFINGGVYLQVASLYFPVSGGNYALSSVDVVPIALGATTVLSAGYWLNGSTNTSLYGSSIQIVPKRVV